MSDETQQQRPAKRHVGTFEDRGDYIRVVLRVGGRTYRSSPRPSSDLYLAPTRDAKVLAKWAREKHRELTQQQAKHRRGTHSETRFSALLSQYERDELPTLAPGTVRSYRDSFVGFRAYFVDELRDPTLERISTAQVKGFLAWRRTARRAGKHQTAGTDPVSNRTLAKDRAVLHRLFDFAYRLELLDGNPVARVEQPKADPRSPVLLSDEQYEKLLEECAPRPQLWLYALLLGETGGRCVSEALHIRWTDVDLAGGFIEIRSEGRAAHRTKSGNSRFVPMTPRLLAALKAHAERTRMVTYHGTRTEWVFHHERDRRGCKAGERVKTMRSAFDTAQKSAGIVDAFHRHDLRHRRATSWLAAGANPVHVKEALGHSDLRTTMGYTHLSKEHLRSLVAPAASPAPAQATTKQA